MINLIYEILKVILNKEQRGNVTPAEFNYLAKQVQETIFRGYFTDLSRDTLRDNRGVGAAGFASFVHNQRQRIDRFAKTATLSFDTPNFDLPNDLYMLYQHGITTSTGIVIEEVSPSKVGYLGQSSAAPSATFPVYERVNEGEILISPSSINSGVTCRYIRKPLDPNWTYTEVSGEPLFNAADADYQDFELHPDEFSNIVIQMLSYFGINIRESEVAQYAEALKQKQDSKEES